MIIRDSIDPLSEAGMANESSVIMARSESMRVLQDELARYCRRQIQGRSFLIAGHRGAGKTMLVAEAIRENMTGDPQSGVLRPLPVFLHGPCLLHTLPSDMRRDEFSLADMEPSRAADMLRTAPPQPPNANAGGATATDADFTEAQERRVQQGLVHMILCLHRAVVREFSRHYREAVLTRGEGSTESYELAARFEIELLEDPRASRLREFWELAGALDTGVLIKTDDARAVDQGMRELVALNGMCNAHQRISGALSQKETQNAAINQGPSSSGGFDAKAVDALKPLGAILTGGLVASGSAIGLEQLLLPSLFGVLTAWAAARFLQSTVTTAQTRTRMTDQIFIPDLTPRTLDRVLPALLDRLREAGLAPVLIVDELDKVHDLPNRIERLVSFLKKLVAENVFSCFLTDRSYFEHLRTAERGGKRYSRSSSYFTHRMMVAYSPREIDAYLVELLAASDEVEEIDRTVLRWVLRHRSRLHGLNLQREIAALRGRNNAVNIPAGAIRSDYQYLIDLTMQVAIELTLYSKEVSAWCNRHPALQSVLYDALYFLSRSWHRGDAMVDVTPPGMEIIINEIIDLIDLSELRPAQGAHTDVTPPLGSDDMRMLRGVVARVALLLSEETSREAIEAQWNEIVARLRWDTKSRMRPEVLVALLVGKQSLLVSQGTTTATTGSPPTTSNPPANTTRHPGAVYRWRYWCSGIARPGLEPAIFELDAQRKTDLPDAIKLLRSCSDSIGEELSDQNDPTVQDGFALLGDVFRVIKTTPAWSQVRHALTNLEQVLAGSGDLISLERDLRTFDDFDALLTEGVPAVAQLLYSSAFISGLVSTKERTMSIRACAALISTGLGFAHIKPEDALARISMFLDGLTQRYPELRPALGQSFTLANAPTQKLEICSDAFRSAIGDCASVGGRSACDWQTTTEHAWRDLEQRIKPHGDSTEHVPATLQEILCAARKVGPGLFLNLDLSRTTLAEWTRLLLRSLNVKKTDAAQEYVPVTLSVAALFQLGGRNVPREHVEKMLRMARSDSSEVRALLSAVRWPRSAAQAPGRAALVIGRGQDSVTSDWRSEPTLGVVFVLDASEDLETAFKLAREVNPQRPVRMVFEEPANDPDTLVKNATGSTTAPDHQVVLMSRTASTPELRLPTIMDPTGPDAVFRRPREPRSASTRR